MIAASRSLVASLVVLRSIWNVDKIRDRVWFRSYKVECVDIPSTNQSDTCSYSVFNESVRFKDGLYEFALSPHNTTLKRVHNPKRSQNQLLTKFTMQTHQPLKK